MLKTIIKLSIFSFIALLIIASAVFIYFAKNLPNPENLSVRKFDQSTKILDRTGEIILYEVHNETKRTIISFEEISPYAVKATLAIEDADFYNHYGIDLKAILRASWINIEDLGISQGGSTITQQFIKNALLTNKKTFARKIREIILALELERKYSKDEILSFYFNQIPYGSNNYGIEAAAQSYFGKKARDLSLGEASILAALTKAPTYYSPYGDNSNELISRQKIVLERMLNLGFISQEEFEKAKNEKIKFKIEDRGIKAPHFVIYVRQLLNEKYGEDFVERSGLKVYTTLNWDLQQKAEEIVREGAIINEKKYRGYNAALVSIDPRSGEVLTMVGSRDYFNIDNDGNVNVTTRLNQPGSAFKPIAYAAAFQKGFTPETILFDLVTNFGRYGSGDYIPQNYNLKTYGPVTMREALAQSLNIPAVKTLYLAGIDNTINLAERMGITTLKDRERFGLSLVLGGGDVTLLEMTSAFGVFAHEGILYKPTTILRIEDNNGNVLEEFKSKKERVLDMEISRKINSILSDNIARTPIFGEKNSLTLPDRPVAAKTGTTEDFIDAWTLGYTPQLVAGVWVGNNDNKKMLNADGSAAAAPIWNKFMREAMANKEVLKFNDQQSSTAPKSILRGSFQNEEIVRIDKISGKKATEFTPEELIEERMYKQIHSILYYVNKDDPLGPKPDNPDNDPQFQRWEGPVLAWARQYNFFNEPIPTEFDNVHIPENQPSLNILSPASGSSISNSIELNLDIDAPLGPKEADLFINGKFIQKVTSFPFSRIIIPQNIQGQTLTVKLYDQALNSVIRSQSISLKNKNNESLILSENNNVLVLDSAIELKKVIFYYKKVSNFERVKIISTLQNDSKNFSMRWINPSHNTVEIFAIGEDDNGNSWVSNSVNLN